MTISSPQNSMEDAARETLWGMMISLGFWFCLLISAVLFAVVALSPKLLTYLQLRHQFDSNQLQLVALERQAGQLRRVVEAVRDDEDFAAELTRIEFDAVQPDEEILPVDGSLTLDAIATGSSTSLLAVMDPWYEPVVRFLASDARSRLSILGSAALLVVISFTILQPDEPARASAKARGQVSLWRSLRNRYVRRVG
jgi:hypothetical protein